MCWIFIFSLCFCLYHVFSSETMRQQFFTTLVRNFWYSSEMIYCQILSLIILSFLCPECGFSNSFLGLAFFCLYYNHLKVGLMHNSLKNFWPVVFPSYQEIPLLRRYFLGLLTHTTACDRLWGGDFLFRLYIGSSASPSMAAV